MHAAAKPRDRLPILGYFTSGQLIPPSAASFTDGCPRRHFFTFGRLLLLQQRRRSTQPASILGKGRMHGATNPVQAETWSFILSPPRLSRRGDRSEHPIQPHPRARPYARRGLLSTDRHPVLPPFTSGQLIPPSAASVAGPWNGPCAAMRQSAEARPVPNSPFSHPTVSFRPPASGAHSANERISSATLRSFTRRGTLFLPRARIQPRKCPCPTTVRCCRSSVVHRLAS